MERKTPTPETFESSEGVTLKLKVYVGECKPFFEYRERRNKNRLFVYTVFSGGCGVGGSEGSLQSSILREIKRIRVPLKPLIFQRGVGATSRSQT